MEVKKERDTSLDIIRITALVLVITVHSFNINGFYADQESGLIMLIATIFRTLAMSCVPLFMILSGFLLANKTPDKKYFKGILKTLGTYLLASIACYVFKVFFLKETTFSIASLIGGIFNFSAASYSWYIEMYIGMFLLAPFLNLAYRNLPTKKHKMLLLGIMLFLTSLPGIVNIFHFSVEGGAMSVNLLSNDGYLKITPDYWSALYPITYYFIGSFLREFPIKTKKLKLCIWLVIVSICSGLFGFMRSKNTQYVWGPWQNYGSLLIVAPSVLIFSIIYGCKFPKNSSLKKFLAKLSELCLGAYLLSYISDQITKSLLSSYPLGMEFRLKFLPIIIIVEVIASFAMSFILKNIQNYGSRFINWLFRGGEKNVQ